jgi:hypothetical protein
MSFARKAAQKNKNPTSFSLIGSDGNLAALAGFITRPQADPQIGARITVRRIPAVVNRARGAVRISR